MRTCDFGALSVIHYYGRHREQVRNHQELNQPRVSGDTFVSLVMIEGKLNGDDEN